MGKRAMVTTATLLAGAIWLGLWGLNPERGNAEVLDDSQSQKAVLDQLRELQRAAQALDADKLFSYVLENNQGVLAQDGRLYLTRQQALESTRRGLAALQNIRYRFTDEHVTLLSPTIALAVQQGSATATAADGQSFSRPFVQSVLLVLTNGQWKVFHAHRSTPVEASR